MAVAALVAFLSLIVMVWVGVRAAFFSNLEYETAKAALGDISYSADIACGMGNGNMQLAQVKVGGAITFDDTGRIALKYSKNTVYSQTQCRFSPRSIEVKAGDTLIIENSGGLTLVWKSE